MRQLKITEQITNRNEASVSSYLNELTNLSLLDKETESELAFRSNEGDREAMRQLVNGNLRFVVSVAKKYQNHGLPLADLISEGNLGLIEAAKRFDATRGFKFISYAVWWIRQSIMSALMEHKQLIRLPVRLQTLSGQVKRLSATFEGEHNRRPTVDELSELMEIGRDRVNEVVFAPGFAQTSVYVPEEGTLFNQVDVEPDKDPLADELIDPDESKTRVRALLKGLSERDRMVVELSFGLNGHVETSNVDIARIIDLSPEMVRVILNRALKNCKAAALVTSL